MALFRLFSYGEIWLELEEFWISQYIFSLMVDKDIAWSDGRVLVLEMVEEVQGSNNMVEHSEYLGFKMV